MNGDTNKHKPLSREELFRLLETKDENTLPGAELDDFEKEALEGFSKHSSVEKARELSNEIDVLIHKNLNEKKTSRPVPRVVWFSAAASVLLLVILSFYFLAETAGPGTPEIALNNNSNVPGEDTKPVTPPAEESDATVPREPARKEMVLDELQQQTVTVETKNMLNKSANVSAMDKDDASTEKLRTGAVDYNLATINATTSSATDVVATNGVTPSPDKKQDVGLNNANSEKSKFSSAPTLENEDLKVSASGNGAVVVNKGASQQKQDQPAPVTVNEKLAKEQETQVYEFAANAPVAAKQTKSKQRKKAEADKLVVASGTTVQTKEEEKSPSAPANNSAYANNSAFYTGGEEAVKTYVLNWLKQQHYKENEVQGTYKVRIKILANGTVNVIAIEPEKSGYANMTEHLKKALNSMDGWKPAVINGSVSESEMVIHLAF